MEVRDVVSKRPYEGAGVRRRDCGIGPGTGDRPKARAGRPFDARMHGASVAVGPAPRLERRARLLMVESRWLQAGVSSTDVNAASAAESSFLRAERADSACVAPAARRPDAETAFLARHEPRSPVA